MDPEVESNSSSPTDSGDSAPSGRAWKAPSDLAPKQQAGFRAGHQREGGHGP